MRKIKKVIIGGIMYFFLYYLFRYTGLIYLNSFFYRNVLLNLFSKERSVIHQMTLLIISGSIVIIILLALLILLVMFL